MVKSYFSSDELKCKCGCDQALIDLRALKMLNELRESDGKPMILLSAYRCPAHNAAVGGAKSSKHMEGIAFDIRLDGRDQNRLAEMAKAVGFNGIGFYKSFLHVDARTKPTTWTG